MALPREFSDKLQEAFEARWIYVLIDNVIYYMEIFHVSWMNSDIMIRHKEGWVWVINPYEYGETWSLDKNDLIRRSKYDSNR